MRNDYFMKPDITWIQPYYHVLLGYIPLDVNTVLDVGAGYGIFGYIIQKTRRCTISSIEPFYEDLPHNGVHYKMTWEEWYAGWKKHYDVLVATELVEHLPPLEALLFLQQAKEVADRIIIGTPIKFEEQPPYDGNEYQKHLSVISEAQFKELGYTTVLYNDSILAVWVK